MLIDWFTVGAQVLNFLVLVWLMKRFLYKPVLDAIDAREARIAAELADADAKKTEAQKERDTFQQKNAAFEQQRAALLAKASADAEVHGAQLIDAARNAAEVLRRQHEEVLRNDAVQLHQAIGQRAQQEVFAIARKALTDLAGVSLEGQMTAHFIERLHALDAPARAGLDAAFKAAQTTALVRSAFVLPTAQRASIQQAVNDVFAAEIGLRFDTAPELIGGIELSAGGQKLAWSIESYLRSLESSIADLLKVKERTAVRKPVADGAQPATVPAAAPAAATAAGQS